MNRLPFITAMLSVIGALALLLVAEGVNDGAHGGRVESGAGPTAVPESPRAVCEATENSLRERIDVSRYCSSDDDCTLFDYGYPIDCLTSVAKAEITALRHAYRDYEQSCEHRVYYDCPTEPMQRRAVCRGERCAVSLDDVETLKDETLEHLGVKRSSSKR